MTALLRIKGLSKSFGGVHAVADVSFDVPQGVIFALIGPNGAGKSTIVNLLTGAISPSAGSVILGDRNITDLAPHRIAAAGMARTFQNGRLFRRLSVLDNVMVSASHKDPVGVLDILVRSPRFRRRERAMREASLEALRKLSLEHVADKNVTSLPFGQQRMIEISRALVLNPSLLILDEPAAGINSSEVPAFIEMLEGLRRGGLTIMIIEHNMKLIMTVADRIAVINFGKMISEGTPDEVRRDPAVLEAYLGKGTAHA